MAIDSELIDRVADRRGPRHRRQREADRCAGRHQDDVGRAEAALTGVGHGATPTPRTKIGGGHHVAR